VKEAQRLGIPVFGIVDTNSNPNEIDFVIPANDDATKSVDVILAAMVAAIQEGLDERKVEKVDAAEAGEAPVAKEKKSRVAKRPRTQKEDEEALNLNVAKKFIKDEE
jgi:small subunit ribosomal protein S2